MEISTRIIVVLVLVLLVVVVISSFFLFQTGTSAGKAQAEAVFRSQCLSYQKQNCAWRVTEMPEFQGFVDSCKILYGQDREAFSCLYSLCTQCKSFALENVRCESICRGIDGEKTLGNDINEACGIYKSDCGKVACRICA